MLNNKRTEDIIHMASVVSIVQSSFNSTESQVDTSLPASQPFDLLEIRSINGHAGHTAFKHRN